jgi:hypothetical protein
MTDTTETEITLRIRLDRPVSAAALAEELALHIAPLVSRRISYGDIVIGDDVEGNWALEERAPRPRPAHRMPPAIRPWGSR